MFFPLDMYPCIDMLSRICFHDNVAYMYKKSKQEQYPDRAALTHIYARIKKGYTTNMKSYLSVVKTLLIFSEAQIKEKRSCHFRFKIEPLKYLH